MKMYNIRNTLKGYLYVFMLCYEGKNYQEEHSSGL